MMVGSLDDEMLPGPQRGHRDIHPCETASTSSRSVTIYRVLGSLLGLWGSSSHGRVCVLQAMAVGPVTVREGVFGHNDV